MIHELTSKSRLFFPRRMFNAVIRWIRGIYSPSGTIKVTNTLNPDNERSVALDVDIDAVVSKVRRSIDAGGFSAQQRRDVCGIVRDCLDGVSLYWNDRRASVSDQWLEKFAKGLMEASDDAHTAADAPLPVAGYVATETDAQKIARVGSSPKKAPIDHVHRLPDSVLTEDDIDDGTNNGSVAPSSHQHEAADITDLDNTLADYPTKQEMNTAIESAISSGGGSVPSDVLTGEDIGDTVQAHSDALDALEAELDQNGKVPLSQLTGNIQGHSGDCLVTIDNNGNLGHSENDAYDVLMEITDKSTVNNHVATLPFPEWSAGATKESVLVGTDANGDLKNVVSLPASQNATWDRMIVCAAGGTTLSFKNVRAENPSSTLTLVAGNSTNTTAQGVAHTVADTGENAGKGFVVPVVTRTVWNGSKIYNFYSTMTFDKYGRLYSITKEVRVTVDTPTKVVWS